MAGAPVKYDPETGTWIPVPGYQASPYSPSAFSDDASSDGSWRDPDTVNPSNLDNKLFETPPVPVQPVSPVTGFSLPSLPQSGIPLVSSKNLGSNYSLLKGSNEPAPPGLAFDTKRVLDNLNANCRGTTGACLHNVADALLAGGFDVRAAIDAQRGHGVVAPKGHYWAKDAARAFDSDPSKFKHVAEGFGAKTNAEYIPKIGDIAVWQGGQTGPYGHIQICAGFNADGVAIWKSDFATSPHNWTGMRDADGHGGNFTVYRQEPAEPVVAQAKPETRKDATVAANASPPKPAAALQPVAS